VSLLRLCGNVYLSFGYKYGYVYCLYVYRASVGMLARSSGACFRPGQAHGRLLCGIAGLSALCSCCRGWMVLRVVLCAELMFWLCCLVGFVCCHKLLQHTIITKHQCGTKENTQHHPAPTARAKSRQARYLYGIRMYKHTDM
jgi:hypothetical protein